LKFQVTTTNEVQSPHILKWNLFYGEICLNQLGTCDVFKNAAKHESHYGLLHRAPTDKLFQSPVDGKAKEIDKHKNSECRVLLGL